MASRAMLSGVYGGLPAPYTFNLKKSNTARVRAVYQARARNVIVASMGDSTIRGTDEGAVPYNSQFGGAMPMQLASQLRAAGIAAGANNLFGSGTTTIADLALRDSRFTSTGGSVFGSVQTQGGADFNFPTIASSVSFTFPDSVDTAEIYWRDAVAGRNFNWQVDGGAATQINSSGVSQMVKSTIALGSLAAHTITLNWVAGSVNIFGVNAYNSTRKEVSCFNWGVNGGTTATMVGNVGPPNGGRLQFLTSFPPDLVLGELGIVNSERNSMSVATAKAEMLQLVQAVKVANSDFIFVTPPYDSSGLGLTADQESYVVSMYEIAVSEDVPLIDTRRKWLSAANQTARGLVGDNVHPTAAAGYPDMAVMAASVIQFALAA